MVYIKQIVRTAMKRLKILPSIWRKGKATNMNTKCGQQNFIFAKFSTLSTSSFKSVWQTASWDIPSLSMEPRFSVGQMMRQKVELIQCQEYFQESPNVNSKSLVLVEPFSCLMLSVFLGWTSLMRRSSSSSGSGSSLLPSSLLWTLVKTFFWQKFFFIDIFSCNSN